MHFKKNYCRKLRGGGNVSHNIFIHLFISWLKLPLSKKKSKELWIKSTILFEIQCYLVQINFNLTCPPSFSQECPTVFVLLPFNDNHSQYGKIVNNSDTLCLSCHHPNFHWWPSSVGELSANCFDKNLGGYGSMSMKPFIFFFLCFW